MEESVIEVNGRDVRGRGRGRLRCCATCGGREGRGRVNVDLREFDFIGVVLARFMWRLFSP